MELQRENQTEFAALCHMEAAKCHDNLRNQTQQANLLLKSGRLYLAARDGRKYFQDDYSGLFFREQSLHSSLSGYTQVGTTTIKTIKNYFKNYCYIYNFFQMAVQSLSQAAKIYQKQNLLGMSVLVTLLIAETLLKSGAYGEAQRYYRSALDLVRANFTCVDVILVTEQLIRCKLLQTDYDGCLKMINDTLIMIGNCSEEELSDDLRAQVWNRLEISRVCLMLLLGTAKVDVLSFIWPPVDDNRYQVESRELGLRTMGDSTASSPDSLGDDDCDRQVKSVKTLLKSLVIAVQHGSVEEVEGVRSHLAPIMQQGHHDLFAMLIKILS